ncbi:glycogen/starch/alpha-glucan phosphorylase [Pseudohaliea rubra]|uniref:Alpha-1,4 glucan phosphorylase n=1 Tax=Pseudohaliea rubra DSM 19751 TaxID=1265313 RepID=A0A095VMN8_9GAMM|nr:glycogen/starch/alpha-glucan phosphorylase [Pseudohaliea rubra]KGE02620.1 Glycogen phosphorylase [Pseudohaliea rubra DSM 19751]
MSAVNVPGEGQALADAVARHYHLTLGKDRAGGDHHYLYEALALALRDRLVGRWRRTRGQADDSRRRVAYLSLEFLIGRSLHNALLSLDLEAEAREAVAAFACDLETVEAEERDAGLGNGGLGRLAACFLDSCATLALPVTGYGIRYEYGMFQQQLRDGYQVENPDRWLRDGNPWEFEVPERIRRVHFGGRAEGYRDDHGRWRHRWVDAQSVLAIPFDMPVPGYRNGTVNTLRLWRAAATEEFDLGEFNAGSYTDAVDAKTQAEKITMVLYPNDQSEAGKELRLRQQYFLASASLQDILADWLAAHGEDFTGFADGYCLQLNDTHPTVSIPELMRLLMDEHGLGWDAAWAITRESFAYTNHTLLPEALETWSVALFGSLLPRLLEIIQEINACFLTEVSRQWPGDVDRERRMSLIDEAGDPQLRMAYLGIVGSFSVNGVAALHTRLLTRGLFRDFHELWPAKFNNKTNGVTPRRWLAYCNPGLAALIDETLGDGWVCDLERLRELTPRAEDPAFRERFATVKFDNKRRLAGLVADSCGVAFDPAMLFDVQVKRIHEYKRQLLNVLHIIHRYDRVLRGDTAGLAPRCVLLGGKAAPGYAMAKAIIKLVNNVAAVVNDDPRLAPWLRVAFLPDYKVTSMEVVCPGADLSEQLSTAGKEASGTGNMKFMMNGAVTIGTLDGANIEILEAVGEDNFFLFGLTAEEVEARRPNYRPRDVVAADDDLQRVLQLLESGHFSLLEPGIFDAVLAAMTSPADPWMTLADFRSYVDAQHRVDAAWHDREDWLRRCILNTAASGRFSSDRTIREYGRDIWFRKGATR